MNSPQNETVKRNIENRKNQVSILIPHKEIGELFLSNVLFSVKSNPYTLCLLSMCIVLLKSIDLTLRLNEYSNHLTVLDSLKNYINNLEVEETNSQRIITKIKIAKVFFFTLFDYKYFFNSNTINWDDVSDLFLMTPQDKAKIHHILLEKFCPNTQFYSFVKTYLSSKKIEKNYLSIYVKALKNINCINESFTDESIRNGLLNYKSELTLNKEQTTTEYHSFQRAKELFTALQRNQIISKSIVLPKGFDKPANSNKTRKNNPTIASLSIHNMHSKTEIISSSEYIIKYHESLKRNLDICLSTARKVVKSAYNIFYHTQISMLDDSPENNRLRIIIEKFDTTSSLLASNYNITQSDKECGITRRKLLLANGLTAEICAAMQLIIIEEEGVNPTSLYKALVNPTGKKTEYIRVLSDGSVEYKVIKWRQRKLQNRTSELANMASPEKINLEDINASFCFQYALKARIKHSEYLNSNRLWLFEGNHGIKELPKSADHNFSLFYSRYLSDVEELPKVTLMKIRSSKAVDIYLSTNGDIIQVCQYLGNKVKTALATYIPLFLQEAIYRKKINNFQEMYLILSTATLDDKLQILDISEKDYKNRVQAIFENIDFGGELFELMKKKEPSSSGNSNEVFFICSESNFIYAINLIKNSNYSCKADERVINTCKDALARAARGPIAIQKMLRNAKRTLGQDIDNA
ncbi:hypothetical protein [Psychromonas sp. SA13A]|uniref:hypothetical protein n=1 Tax=Psychromonas sp. SA13A TaxID=2686346 RepID=UPI001409E0E3|nr:hypothetical protein [Psychromonas sp. SA13A]